MRAPNTDGSFDVAIPSEPEAARLLQEMIEAQLRQQRFDDREIFGIRLALEEALVNAIKHGNQMDRSKKVHVHFRVEPDRFHIHITDEGTGFDPDDVPDPQAAENLERCCGRGLLLMRHYMSEVTFHPPGNHLTMCKIRSANGHHASHP